MRGEVEKRGKSKMDCTKKSQEANVKCEKRVMILSCLLVLVLCLCWFCCWLVTGNRRKQLAGTILSLTRSAMLLLYCTTLQLQQQ